MLCQGESRICRCTRPLFRDVELFGLVERTASPSSEAYHFAVAALNDVGEGERSVAAQLVAPTTGSVTGDILRQQHCSLHCAGGLAASVWRAQ